MMPGRYYQMVEVLAPSGFQIPFGQWRFRVTDASVTNMAGTGLYWSTVGSGVPNLVPANNAPTTNLPIHCQHIPSLASYYHLCSVDNCAGCDIAMRVHHIPNLPEFYMPLTGGTGMPLAITAAGALLIGLSTAVVFVKAKRGKVSKARP